MLDAVREKLIEIVEQNGPAISEEPSLCECFLVPRNKDTDNAIDALLVAIRQGVTTELRLAKQDFLNRIHLDEKIRKLCSVGVKPELASWAVETWAKAIGVSDRVHYRVDFKCPACDASGVSLKKIAGRTIKCPRCKSRISVSVDGSKFTLVLEDKPVSGDIARSLGISSEYPTTEIAAQNNSEPSDSLRVSATPKDSIECETVSAQSVKEPSLEFTNSIGMQFRLIQPGIFRMGSKKHGSEIAISEPFYLGIHPVTQEQYEEVMGKTPSRFKGPAKPVECVTWHDAVSFCRELSRLCSEIAENRCYRLPTEAEWEYACRAGSDSDFCFGNDPSQLFEYAWFGNNFGKGPRYVGQKKPNAWGLYDMHGNISEWCASRFDDYPNFSAEVCSDDKDNTKRTYRGGHWFNQARFCRSATRHGEPPMFWSDYVGFRVALNVH